MKEKHHWSWIWKKVATLRYKQGRIEIQTSSVASAPFMGFVDCYSFIQLDSVQIAQWRLAENLELFLGRSKMANTTISENNCFFFLISNLILFINKKKLKFLINDDTITFIFRGRLNLEIVLYLRRLFFLM